SLHPEWFFHRPDGTIKYAENPPKKYQDAYPLNFLCADPAPLWQEMRRIIEFWVAHGVHAFRVDNPHTKPVKFWAWLIREVQDAHPDVIFLAEAFTRPKMMKALAKAGFTQSYTYFTWRNENKPAAPGSEEYLDSEKYELKRRDWNAPRNLGDFITRVNRIRRENRALQLYTNLSFYRADNPRVLFYGKMTPERDNVVFVAASLDPFAALASMVDVPIAELGIGEQQTCRLRVPLR